MTWQHKIEYILISVFTVYKGIKVNLLQNNKEQMAQFYQRVITGIGLYVCTMFCTK